MKPFAMLLLLLPPLAGCSSSSESSADPGDVGVGADVDVDSTSGGDTAIGGDSFVGGDSTPLGDSALPDVVTPDTGIPLGDATVTYSCAREIHVAVTGNDANAGTAAAPLKTIAKATPTAKPGDCVLVHAGTYAESTTIGFFAEGTASAPIVVRSVDGRGAAIVDAAGNRSGPTVLIHADYVIVDGFEFRNSPTDTGEQVVHFDGLTKGKGVGSVLRNCKLTGGYDHLKINQASRGILVEHNEFYGTFGHIPISLTGASGLVFRGNYAHDWNTGGNGAVQLKGGSTDVLFEGNRFVDIKSDAGTIALGDGCDSTCDVDPEHYAAVRVRAIDNVMVRVGRGFDVQGCKDCAVLSNTIVDSGVGNVIFKLTKATTNGVTHDTLNARIVDNLVANSGGDQGEVIQVNDPSGAGLQMDYNLVWNGAKPVSWGGSHPSSADAHSITKDPLFVAAASGDYSLKAGSPAIAAGLNVIADVPVDFDGTKRPATAAFDLGAFQTR